MQLLQITVTKDIANGGVKFNYPSGYNAQNIVIDAYEHQADSTKNGTTELCYGRASDDFATGTGIVTMNQTDYDAAVAVIKGA